MDGCVVILITHTSLDLPLRNWRNIRDYLRRPIGILDAYTPFSLYSITLLILSYGRVIFLYIYVIGLAHIQFALKILMIT